MHHEKGRRNRDACIPGCGSLFRGIRRLRRRFLSRLRIKNRAWLVTMLFAQMVPYGDGSSAALRIKNRAWLVAEALSKHDYNRALLILKHHPVILLLVIDIY